MMTYDEYIRLLTEASVRQSQGDYDGAVKALQEIIDRGDSAMSAYALYTRGEINERQGFLSTAKGDWLEAWDRAPEGTYVRYLCCVSIGKVCEREESLDEALGWYRKAVHTCAEGQEFSGQSVLPHFLRLNGGTIPDEDGDTVIQVIEKSRRVLEFPEEPNLDDLPTAIENLSREFAALVERIKNETE